MPMQSNKNSYEGQNVYVGIDVHARQWHIYASPWPGVGAKAICIPPDAKGLRSYLNRTYPRAHYISAYESGFCGFSVHRQLVTDGIDNLVFNAADLKKSQKEQLRKSDSIDCKAIWENLAKGDLHNIYVPTQEEEEDRELIRGREVAVKDIRRAKQRIKMFLHKLGVETPSEFQGKESYWSESYMNWLHILSDSLNGGCGLKLKAQLDNHTHLKEQVNQYNREIHKVMTDKHSEMYELLVSIPGVGRLLAAKLCLELINFSRFADARHLAAYIGLVPDCKASDQTVAVIGTTIRRNSILRTALIEASWIAVSKDPSLGSFFSKSRAAGKHANLAIISVARKLVNRIYYVWRTKKKYEVSKD